MISDIVNNYSMMSFNFGPTVLSWMEVHEPEVYTAILEADRVSRKRFSGHGSAIAQPYNHMIMPLANARDKHTQVIWGIRDFVHRFGRKPEGMWLPETAVDVETLDVLAEHGIIFTILAPHQASGTRPLGGAKRRGKSWQDVTGGSIDPRRPYLCRLSSGREINIFFYDGPISVDVSFNDLLDSGPRFAERLTAAFSDSNEAQLVHIASDGEVYGHHKSFAEMGLAWCLRHLEEEQLAIITNYGEYLEKHPPTYEVKTAECTSWSCSHGVERWKDDCGCSTGMNPGWTQTWRAPLRDGLNCLRDGLGELFEAEMAELTDDPWGARDDYISLLLERNAESIEEFLKSHIGAEYSHDRKVTFLKLLEIQRHAMLMYTSCGWFFDDINRIEPVQLMKYAARAIQLAREVSGKDYEPDLLRTLAKAHSNKSEPKDGAGIYLAVAKPDAFDFGKVCAHYAMLALSDAEPRRQRIGAYEIGCKDSRTSDAPGRRLRQGVAVVSSTVTLEETELHFAAFDLGDFDLRAYVSGKSITRDEGSEIAAVFDEGDFGRMDALLETGWRLYVLTDLAHEYQLEVVSQELEIGVAEVCHLLSDRAARRIESMMEQLADQPSNHELIRKIKDAIKLLRDELNLELDLWRSQNIYMSMVKNAKVSYADKSKAGRKSTGASGSDLFELGLLLGVRPSPSAGPT
jgi:alpha-amylase/alpha-mannosidase (GH57 family)